MFGVARAAQRDQRRRSVVPLNGLHQSVHRDQFAAGGDERHRAAFAGLRERLGVAAPEHVRQRVGGAKRREVAITHQIQHRSIEIERLSAAQDHRADRQTVEQRAGVGARDLGGPARRAPRASPAAASARVAAAAGARGAAPGSIGAPAGIVLAPRAISRRAPERSRERRRARSSSGSRFRARRRRGALFGRRRKRAQRAGADRHDVRAAGLPEAGLAGNDDFAAAIAGAAAKRAWRARRSRSPRDIGARLDGAAGFGAPAAGGEVSLGGRLDGLAGNRFAGEEAKAAEAGEAPPAVEDRRPGNQRDSRARRGRVRARRAAAPKRCDAPRSPAARSPAGSRPTRALSAASDSPGLGRVRADASPRARDRLGRNDRRRRGSTESGGATRSRRAALACRRFGERRRRRFGFAGSGGGAMTRKSRPCGEAIRAHRSPTGRGSRPA